MQGFKERTESYGSTMNGKVAVFLGHFDTDSMEAF